jgi:hypothetical protein
MDTEIIIQERCMAFGKWITETAAHNPVLEETRQKIITIGNKRRAGKTLTQQEINGVYGAIQGYMLASGYDVNGDVDTYWKMGVAAVLLHDETSKGE